MERTELKRKYLVIVDDPARFSRAAAEWIAGKINDIVASKERCALALAGGETPRPIYVLLARPDFRQKIEWHKIDFYFGDERCVPPDHPDSNYRMAHESLFSRLPIDPLQIKRIHAEIPDRDQAAAAYESELPPKLDLILLGMGNDGHTASLFPGSPALNEKKRLVLAVKISKPPLWRISIAPPVIANARSVLVMVSGKSKAAMVARAFQGPFDPREVPVQLALDGTWIIDKPAAAELEKLKI